MAYTSAQLTAAWTAANDGVTPDAATSTLLTAFAVQTQTGQLSDAAALAYVINSADKTTAVAVEAYQFFTGKTPSKAGLDYLVNSTTNATDLNDPYYQAFNIENRFMNFAANLGIVGEGATAFNTTYGTAAIPVWSTFVGTIYETIIGSSYAVAAGINVTAAINDVISRQSAFTQVARERGIITATSTQAQIDIATRAVAVGYLLVEGIKADVGVYAAGSNNFVNSLINGTAVYNVNLLTTYSIMGGGVGSPVSNGSPIIGGTPGTTYNLTAGIDGLTGTVNDDIFNGAVITNAAVGGALQTTFNAADTINGGNGNDTLNITLTDNGVAALGANLAIPAAGVTAVESVNVRSSFAANAFEITGVATNFAGATSFTNDRSTQTLNLTSVASTQAVGINGLGGGTVVGGIKADYNTAAGLGTTAYTAVVNLSGGTGSSTTVGPAVALTSGVSAGGANGTIQTVTINSNGSVANVVGAVQLDDSGSTVRVLNVKADAALTTGAITGFGGLLGTPTTTGAISITGNANVTLGTINGGAASLTTLNITTGPGTLTTGAIGGTALFNPNATINVSGGATTTVANAASVTLGNIAAAVTTVNAAGLTAGGASVSLGANNTTVFTGGAGTDIVAFGGSVAEIQSFTLVGAATATSTSFFGVATTVAAADPAATVATKIAANSAAIIAANPQIASIVDAGGGVLTVTYIQAAGDVVQPPVATDNGTTFTPATTTNGVNGGAAFTGTINGAGGTDIISFFTGGSLAANLTTLVTNFETLRVSNVTGANQVFDPTLINGITSYQVGTITGAGSTTTLSNLVANASVTVVGANATAANITTLQLKDASGASDVVNVRIDNLSTSPTGAAGLNAGVIALGGTASAGQVETLNVISAGKQSATGAYNSLTLAPSGAAAPFADANTVNVSGSVGLTLNLGFHQHTQTVDASANTFGVAINSVSVAGLLGAEVIIGTSSNDTITVGAAGSNVANTATIYGGAGGDVIALNIGTQTILYKAATDSVLDLASSGVGQVAASGNLQSGVAATGTTKTTSGMDVIYGFTSGIDKIDVSTFGFGVGGLGGGIVDKGTVASDAAFNTLVTTGTGVTGVFGNGAIQRGLAIIHTTAGTSDGMVSDILLIDVNKDGVFTASSDIAVKLVGGTVGAVAAPGALLITDFII